MILHHQKVLNKNKVIVSVYAHLNIYKKQRSPNYLKEIKDLEPLSNVEKVCLTQRAKSCVTNAINELVTHNLRYLIAVAKKSKNMVFPLKIQWPPGLTSLPQRMTVQKRR